MDSSSSHRALRCSPPAHPLLARARPQAEPWGLFLLDPAVRECCGCEAANTRACVAFSFFFFFGRCGKAVVGWVSWIQLRWRRLCRWVIITPPRGRDRVAWDVRPFYGFFSFIKKNGFFLIFLLERIRDPVRSAACSRGGRPAGPPSRISCAAPLCFRACGEPVIAPLRSCPKDFWI